MNVPEKKISIFAIHAGLNPRMRKKQIEYLETEVNKEQNAGRKIIILGDFNASLKEINRVSPVLAGFQGTSLPTNCYLIYNWLKKIFADDIDHVLCSKEFMLKDANIYKDMSDHRLLLCNLESNLNYDKDLKDA